MAEFEKAFDRTVKLEGGYELSHVTNDKGGQTYAGIARKFHPDWAGWKAVDVGEVPDTESVREFYKKEFWDVLQASELTDQLTADTVYDFAVNASPKMAVKLAQLVVGASADGVMGPKTIAALNGYDAQMFQLQYALAKVQRYVQICTKDKSQRMFLLGWLNRTLKGLA